VLSKVISPPDFRLRGRRALHSMRWEIKRPLENCCRLLERRAIITHRFYAAILCRLLQSIRLHITPI
jgi:hypothetical protein